MESNLSRLGYLMKILEISGRELAIELAVDTTTISKWKNKQRKLTYKSKYTRELAQYFLNSPLQNKRGKIIELLKVAMPAINTDSSHQIFDALCLWLTEQEPSKSEISNPQPGDNRSPVNGYHTNAMIYMGYQGIEEALEKFWKYTLRIPSGQEILLADYRDINFDIEDQAKIERIMKLLIDAAKYGHTIKIIDCATDEARPYLAIFRWLPLYLSENVEVWRFPYYYEGETRISTFVLPNEIVLNSLSIDSYPEEHQNIIFQDKSTVCFWEKSVLATLKRSKKMIETIHTSDILRVLEILNLYLKSKQLTYMLNPVPTFRNMSAELLVDILRENQVDQEIVEICIEANRRTQAIRERCRYLQIYDLDALEATVHNKSIIDYDLSAICGKEIIVSKRNFCRHLEYIVRLEHTKDYSITLTSFSALGLISTNISLVVQDDSLVVAWNTKKYPLRMYCREIVVINGFYTYMADLWKVIPPVCKTKEWTDKQFIRMIQMLQ
jgi:transcriptional regulator with XRE-family HTH domain